MGFMFLGPIWPLSELNPLGWSCTKSMLQQKRPYNLCIIFCCDLYFCATPPLGQNFMY